jgi:hypothetical protein
MALANAISSPVNKDKLETQFFTFTVSFYPLLFTPYRSDPSFIGMSWRSNATTTPETTSEKTLRAQGRFVEENLAVGSLLSPLLWRP